MVLVFTESLALEDMTHAASTESLVKGASTFLELGETAVRAASTNPEHGETLVLVVSMEVVTGAFLGERVVAKKSNYTHNTERR